MMILCTVVVACTANSDGVADVEEQGKEFLADVLLYDDMLDYLIRSNKARADSSPAPSEIKHSFRIPSRSEFKENYVRYIKELTTPLEDIELHVFSKDSPVSTDYYVLAFAHDSVWIFAERHEDALTSMAFHVSSVNNQLKGYMDSDVDSLAAISLARLPFDIASALRSFDPVVLNSWHDIPYADREAYQLTMRWPKDDYQQSFLQEIIPPQARRAKSGYDVDIYYWKNDRGVRRATLKVTADGIELVEDVLVGKAGLVLMRRD